MPDEKAKQIVADRERAKAHQGTFRHLWQSVSDLMFPHTYGIETVLSPGQELMAELFDTTAMEEAENMTSGISVNLFPPGQRFFQVKPSNPKASSAATRYTDMVTELAHEAIANSNFMPQINNTIHYWVTFGTGAFFTEWRDGGLNCRDYAIGTYQCRENFKGVVDTMFLSYPMTARQIVQQFGYAKAGESVQKAYDKPDGREDAFDVIHCIKPRPEFDPNTYLRPNDRMPFASYYVNEKDNVILEEGGYDEFPFAVPRYSVIYREVYGRGRGVTMLPQVRILNRLNKDYLEMSNKWVNPPRQVLSTFEGTVDVTPGANNYVPEMDSIRAIEMGAHGAYPITKDILEYYREQIRMGFFKNVFEALSMLQGDRRTATEIIERLKEGMKKLSKPLGRLFDELLTPVLTRITLLMIRNGFIPYPPAELQGQPFKIQIVNPLALALADQESRGLQYWVEAGAAMEEVFPGVTDNVNVDVAYRDLGRALGVKTEHIRTEADRDRIREERQEMQEAMQQSALANQAADTYGKATKAPGAGSPAQLIGA